MDESNSQFESRKADHLRLSLADKNEAFGRTGLDRLELLHEALPDLDFKDVNIKMKALGDSTPTPFLISSMTAGHVDSLDLNLRLAQAAEARGWRMGVGSQRRELRDSSAGDEWRELRRAVPKAILYGNVGLAQIIEHPPRVIERLVKSLDARAMIVHLNPLQEVLQPEGTPNFKGGLRALETLASALRVPVILKETGCGFSAATLKRLRCSGIGAVDVGGLGGTHWGRIEGDRAPAVDVRARASVTLADWGISTVESVLDAVKIRPDYEVWASGGVRSGLDAAKLFSLGARIVGLAKPILAAALEGEVALDLRMRQIEFELSAVLFCTGCRTVSELQAKKVWKWRA